MSLSLALLIHNKQPYIRRSDVVPELDGTLREVVRKMISHYHQFYINRPDPIDFLPVAVDTTGQLYDDFRRSLLIHTNCESSALVNCINEIPEESDQFHFLRAASYGNNKGSVGLILVKASDMRISIPLDL